MRSVAGNAVVNAAPRYGGLFGCFGDATVALRYAFLPTAKIIMLPDRRSEIAKLRDEVAELRRAIRA
jgi:hypothetical protein